jgi:hypothetical protein
MAMMADDGLNDFELPNNNTPYYVIVALLPLVYLKTS